MGGTITKKEVKRASRVVYCDKVESFIGTIAVQKSSSGGDIYLNTGIRTLKMSVAQAKSLITVLQAAVK